MIFMRVDRFDILILYFCAVTLTCFRPTLCVSFYIYAFFSMLI